MKQNYFWLAAFVILLSSCSSRKVSLQIQNELKDETVLYALSQLENLAENGLTKTVTKDADLKILTAMNENLDAEAFKIETTGNDITVTGGDATGVMYGLLHIREQLAMGRKTIANIEESPALSFRAIKFNLPWDSYRRGKALQLHEVTCRDTLFWRSFLDMMAENRFNKLTLWNLHPFNYMVKTEKYPEACGFTDDEMVVWETFWNSIFRMARERGIETYVLNWNIFVSPEFAKAHNVAQYSIDGSYYIDQGDTSEIVKDYTREVVKEVINKYPDLTGLGITLGEGMGGMTADERNEWLLESFIEGMRMAGREIKFIYRAPLSAGTGSGGSTDPYVERMTRITLDSLTCVDGPITIELKFNWSHAHSCVELIKVHGGELTDAYWNPPPQNYNLDWMMRNEDFFVLRWGQPDFIRDHIAENVKPWVNGYFIGSETYIPATDYITSLPNTSCTYAFERQWMFYKVWGRLLYKPNTPDKVFSDAFELRFPGNGERLFRAQQKVSRVPLIIGSYWNATWDNTLYSEGMLSIMEHENMKLMSLSQFTSKQPMNPAYISIKKFLASGEKRVPGKITPIELADSLDSFCMKALEEVENIITANNNDLLYEVSDIKTWAHLGMYLSNKLRAAIEYQRFLNDGNKDALQGSVHWLERATQHWQDVVEITTPIYDPMPLQHYERNGDIPFHWSLVEEEVLEELKWLKNIHASE